jgi:uncharacterized protein
VRFDWDHFKARKNLSKHGVSFEQAITAFDDPFARIMEDTDHSTPDERREWLIGLSDAGVLVVVFTVREPGPVYRLISARPVTRRERRQYEEHKGI